MWNIVDDCCRNGQAALEGSDEDEVDGVGLVLHYFPALLGPRSQEEESSEHDPQAR